MVANTQHTSTKAILSSPIINNRLIGEKIPNLPKLPKNEIPGKKNCEMCISIHIVPDQMGVRIDDNHHLFHKPMISWNTEMAENPEKCFACTAFFRSNADGIMNCQCACHHPRQKIVYDYDRIRDYTRTHWTANDIAGAYWLSKYFKNSKDDDYY